MYYIYGIKNLIDNRYYVGMSADVGKRFGQHIKYGERGFESPENKVPTKRGLYVDMYRYGIENFMFKVLEVVKNDSVKLAYDIEEKWIKKFNACVNGYNSTYNASAYSDNNYDGFHSKNNINNYYKLLSNEQIVVFRSCIKMFGLNALSVDCGDFNINEGKLQRYCFVIFNEDEIIRIGTKLADGKDAITKHVTVQLNRKDTSINKYINSLESAESLKIKIIYKADKTDEEYKKFQMEYREKNASKLNTTLFTMLP